MNNHVSIEQLLYDILNKHIQSNTELHEVVRSERDHIVHNRLEELEQVNEKKLALKVAIAKLENERMALLKPFVKKYHISKSQPQLKDLIAVVEEPFHSQYTHQRSALKKLLSAIKITHDGNRILIQKALRFHERSFQLLFGLTKQHLGYEKTGVVKHKNKRLIDSVV